MNKVIRRLRFIFNVKKFIPFLLEFFSSREVTLKKKVLSVLLFAGYLVFPFDIIPDFLVVFGIVDDFVILTYLLQYIVKISPPQLKEKYQLLD